MIGRAFKAVAAAWVLVLFLGSGLRVLADCSSFGLPFTDLGSGTSFCAAIAEAYYTGLTNGTGPTTFSPGSDVTRVQMAAFVTRTLDASLYRGSRRAALGQWWTTTPNYGQGLGVTTVGSAPGLLQSDGSDVWVANSASGTVSRIRASDGRVLETWTGATNPYGVLVAMGRVFITGLSDPGQLYMIDPSLPAGAMTTVSSGLGAYPTGISFDGNRIWTANQMGPDVAGSISIVTPGSWSVTTVATGFSDPIGAVFDGALMWVTDDGDNSIKKLEADGTIALSVAVGSIPGIPVYDGHNLWVPNENDSSLTVVRASDGTILKSFSSANGNQNGLNIPWTAAFDGQRILVTNRGGGLSLFKATDLSPLGTFPLSLSSIPFGACSDGSSFWVSFQAIDSIGRF